jgi:hypothetical protein
VAKLIEAAHWAPSGFNMQPWEFMVVKDLALRTASLLNQRCHIQTCHYPQLPSENFYPQKYFDTSTALTPVL